MTVFWIIVAVICVGLALLAVRERRAGHRVSPDAVQQRRDDTFRMRTGADYYQSSMPRKDPRRG